MRLETDRLSVDIAEPGTTYRGARFDWSSFITQVHLDGRHTFCIPESQGGAGTGGIGLCNEFGPFSPIGFEETPVGEQFPKLGVGLLTRPDAAEYAFFRDYPIQPYSLRVETSPGVIRFEFAPLTCRGYAARLVKTVSVLGNSLSIDYALDNVGSLPIHTHEYCHNFLALNGHAVGPDYRLQLSHPLEPLYHPDIVDNPEFLTWTQAPTQPWKHDLERGPATSSPEPCITEELIPAPVPAGREYWWQLNHVPSGLQVRETLDCPWSTMVLWYAPHVVSPEAFVAVDVEPGETMEWRRTYAFGVKLGARASIQ